MVRRKFRHINDPASIPRRNQDSEILSDQRHLATDEIYQVAPDYCQVRVRKKISRM